MTPSRVPMMSGRMLNSRMCVPGEMYGLKLAASGLEGLYPTMSGISLGGFRRLTLSITNFPSRALTNESSGSGRARSHPQAPAIEEKGRDDESETADNDGGRAKTRADERERRRHAREDHDRGE